MGPFFIAWMIVVLIALVIASMRLGRNSPWGRLAQLYPAVPNAGARGVFVSRLFMNRRFFKNVVHVKVDDSYLHFVPFLLTQLGCTPFSVPWEEISVTDSVDPHAAHAQHEDRLIEQAFVRCAAAGLPRASLPQPACARARDR